MYKGFCLLLLICLSSLAYAQSADYHKLIQSNKPGYKIAKHQKDYHAIRTYLGAIKSPEGKIVYHVITDFSAFRAAVVMHGNSWLLFFTNKGKVAGKYHLSMPDELPYQLKHNKLYFKSAQLNKTQSVLITNKLPKELCTFDCYNIEK